MSATPELVGDITALPAIELYRPPARPDTSALEPGQGRVRWYNRGRGFGLVDFATDSGGQRQVAPVTVHWSQLPATPGSLRHLEAGQIITGQLAPRPPLSEGRPVLPDRLDLMVVGVRVLEGAAV